MARVNSYMSITAGTLWGFDILKGVFDNDDGWAKFGSVEIQVLSASGTVRWKEGLVHDLGLRLGGSRGVCCQI